MDAQVLLLMDPGAELGWAELSETLPSVGGDREHNCHQQKLNSQQEFFFGDNTVLIFKCLSSHFNVFKIVFKGNVHKSVKSSLLTYNVWANATLRF